MDGYHGQQRKGITYIIEEEFYCFSMVCVTYIHVLYNLPCVLLSVLGNMKGYFHSFYSPTERFFLLHLHIRMIWESISYHCIIH